MKKTAIRFLALLAMMLFAQLNARAQQPCPFNPNADFFTNFTRPCYTVTLSGSALAAISAGDLTAKYDWVFFQVNPRYEIIVYGNFPASRLLSISADDDHQGVSAMLKDSEIIPLRPTYVNPFRPGVPFQAGQRYAAVVGFGGTQPGQVSRGCQMNGENVHVNFLDATLRHAEMNWDDDPRTPDTFPPHKAGPSKAGILLVRRYWAEPATLQDKPVLIVRDLTTGCAIPADEAFNLQLLSFSGETYNGWVDNEQIAYHLNYEKNVVGYMCYGRDPNSLISWKRVAQYIPAGHLATAYLNAAIPRPFANSVINGDKFMRMRVRLPVMPNTPCISGCSISGNEELRYWSISFHNAMQNLTLASLGDRNMTIDREGFVTLLVGTTPTPPPQVTPANGYTYLNIGTIPNYNTFGYLEVRNIMPSPLFQCSAKNVPFSTSEYNPQGGYMGEYVPVIDFLSPSDVPLTAAPLRQPNTCVLIPTVPPNQCVE